MPNSGRFDPGEAAPLEQATGCIATPEAPAVRPASFLPPLQQHLLLSRQKDALSGGFDLSPSASEYLDSDDDSVDFQDANDANSSASDLASGLP